MGRHGLTGFQVDLQSANDTLPVGKMQPCSSIGVDLLKPLHQHFDPFPIRSVLQLLSPSGGRVGGKSVSSDQGVHIQTGASGNDGCFAAGDNIIDDGGCHLAVTADGKILIRFCNIDHVVGDVLHLIGCWLCGADVHSPVDLHGIAGNNLTVQFFCHSNSEGGFAGSGRTGDAYDRFHECFLRLGVGFRFVTL